MKPEKILYVDDEAMALKYFDRLVSPLAPVLTASSVEEGKAVLLARGSEVAVLVCDQRMPGERGNELLRHARQHYPHVVRMLTTAYSELGEAIEAINTGEIYRYINKPWELDSLRSDLRNALELASLRAERDELVRDKLLVQHSQLQGSRMAALLMLGAAVQPQGHDAALAQFARAALISGGVAPSVDWRRWEHADLLQAEARRGTEIVAHLHDWLPSFGVRSVGGQALAALAQAVGGEEQGDGVLVRDGATFTGLLGAPAGAPVSRSECAWFAWLLWQNGEAWMEAAPDGWRVTLAPAEPLASDWLADAMERLGG